MPRVHVRNQPTDPLFASLLTYELRLGVTGHRDLRDEAKVVRAIERLFERVNDTLEPRVGAPITWTAVTALARGADQLFAQVVLERWRGRLEVVTPFPVSEYVKDFDVGRERLEFDRLLSRASDVKQLAGDLESGRAAAYLRAGEHVVDTCEIVVAIWDARPSVGGGTGDVVAYAVRQERPVLWIDSDNPDAPPRIIRCLVYGEDGRLATGCWSELDWRVVFLDRPLKEP